MCVFYNEPDKIKDMELSVKELRIGNFITLLGWDEDAGGNIISDASGNETVIVDIDVLRNIIKDDNLTQYDPIPLTEEWLLKFGFKLDSIGKVTYPLNDIKRTDKIYEFETFDYEIDGLKLEVILDLDESVIRRIGVMKCIGNYANDIKHVHQLQNLYFALTNEELTLTK